MCETTGLSQRHACRLAGLSLSTCRYSAQRPAADAQLSLHITELALERRRFGYRRIWQLLRREGLHVNHKRVYRGEVSPEKLVWLDGTAVKFSENDPMMDQLRHNDIEQIGMLPV